MKLRTIAKKHENEVTKREIEALREYIATVMEYIKQQKKQYSELSIEDLKEKIEDEFVESCNEYHSSICNLSGIQMQKVIVEYINENKGVLTNAYYEICNREIKHTNSIKLWGDKDEVARQYIENNLYKFREYEEELHVKVGSKEEEQALKNIFKNGIKELENIEKQENIKIIEIMAQFFKKYQILTKTQRNHNAVLKKLWMEDLQYDVENDESKNTKDVEQFFEKEELEKKSPEELSIFNMFWQNRYAKEVKSIYLAYFAIQQLGLWSRKEIDVKSISADTLKLIIVKYNIINSICVSHYNKVSENEKNDTDPYEMDIKVDWEKDYPIYFKRKMPEAENNLVEDIEECFNGCMATRNIYAIKTNLVCGEIIRLMSSKKIKNWGYISERAEDEKDRQFVLIGIDLPGYNMPVRIHIPKDVLVDRLKNVQKESIIPMYDGAEDFRLNEEVIPTNLFLPLQKKHKEYLRTISTKSKMVFNYNILEHIVFLANPDKFPEHLKQLVNGKQTRVRKYIDLETEKIYMKAKDKYIEVNNGDKTDESR